MDKWAREAWIENIQCNKWNFVWHCWLRQICLSFVFPSFRLNLLPRNFKDIRTIELCALRSPKHVTLGEIVLFRPHLKRLEWSILKVKAPKKIPSAKFGFMLKGLWAKTQFHFIFLTMRLAMFSKIRISYLVSSGTSG